MYYICKKNENSDGVKYGIMDTNDGVIEYHSPKDLIDVMKSRGITVEGVSLNVATGKWHIKVVKHTEFIDVDGSETITEGTDSYLPRLNTATHYKPEYPMDGLVYKIPRESYRGSLNSEDGVTIICPKPCDYKDMNFVVDKDLSAFKTILDDWVMSLIGVSTVAESLNLIDDIYCIGYLRLQIPDNSPYCLSIYSEPTEVNGKLEFSSIFVELTDSCGNLMRIYGKETRENVNISNA